MRIIPTGQNPNYQIPKSNNNKQSFGCQNCEKMTQLIMDESLTMCSRSAVIDYFKKLFSTAVEGKTHRHSFDFGCPTLGWAPSVTTTTSKPLSHEERAAKILNKLTASLKGDRKYFDHHANKIANSK